MGCLGKARPITLGRGRKKKVSPSQLTFFYSLREEIKHRGFCMYGLFPKYENY